MTALFGVDKKREDQVIDHQEENLQNGEIPQTPDEPDENWWASLLIDEPLIDDASENDEPSIPNVIHTGESEYNPPPLNWEKVMDLYHQDEVIVLRVVSYNRGGILVEDGNVSGFVPVSHLIDLPMGAPDTDREQLLTSYLGREIALKVIECEPENERVVFSERAALAGPGQRKALLHRLAEDDVVSGFVTNVTAFGVFVDLGGLEGLIHVSELSWGRVEHPSQILKVGEEVETMVIQVMQDKSRIALSLKQLKKNPWERLSKSLAPGNVIDAVISCIVKYGAFARLDEGVEGLIHISMMNFPKGCTHIDDFLYEGQPVKVGVISIDSQKRRLSLKLESFE
ncbi:MAG: S1 RNA-binding domain-containing protein [Brevefilum sp.]|nr:S1 RNA-binding domain-containing protein [Brevefilum sp.]